MSIKTKFLLYFLITIALSFALVIEVILFYNSSSYIDGLISLVILVIFIALYFVIRKDFLLPFNELQKWVRGYKINQNARLEEKQPSSFQPIASAINHLIEENQYLYDDMETILKKQIQRLSKKSASLETLYGISSKLNKMHSTNELFESFLDIYINMTGARSGVARSLNANGELQLAATRGVIDKNGQVSEILVSDCFCGEIALAQDAYVQFSVHTCAKCVGKKSQQQAKVGSIFIPLRYHNKTLGIFNLFFDIEPSLAQDERALLQSISDNISVALDKARLDRETKRMELSQERLLLSQEMHDSLAQTIYSLKLQTTVLGDSIKNSKIFKTKKVIYKKYSLKNFFKKINNRVNRYDNISIFGAGQKGILLFNNLSNKEKIKFFIDEDKNKFNKNLCGVQIKNPKKINNSSKVLLIDEKKRMFRLSKKYPKINFIKFNCNNFF